MNSIKIKGYFYVFLASILFACTGQKAETKEVESEVEISEKKEKSSEEKRVILFFGNSLTAGLGVESSEAFPSIIQDKLDYFGYDYQVINAGVSGETTSGGLSRVEWVIKRQEVSIFILELGANDGLRGIDPEESARNLKSIIDLVRKEHPQAKIILTGMMVPPNMGKAYSDEFSEIFIEVADEKKVGLVPFLLENVGGIDSLNQADQIHPNPAGHQILADNVWEVLENYLEKD